MTDPGERPLLAIRGDATAEEVAALVTVLHRLAAAARPAPTHSPSQWSAPGRMLRAPLSPGPGGWRASTLPR